jgi:hypothetical protein
MQSIWYYVTGEAQRPDEDAQIAFCDRTVLEALSSTSYGATVSYAFIIATAAVAAGYISSSISSLRQICSLTA